MKRSIIALVTFFALVLGTTSFGVAFAPAASAHTPNITASCSGLVLTATNYDATKTNKYTYFVDDSKPDVAGTFGSDLNLTVAVPQNGATTHVGGHIEAYDGSYSYNFDAYVGPCGTKPPVVNPPPCKTCALPAHATKAPKVTNCRGVLANVTLRNVNVPKGFSCTLVDSWVNGNVKAYGSRSLTLADTTVRKDILVTNMSGDFQFGPKGHCSYDPQVGGSIKVKNSHNATICKASVCKRVSYLHNDGRLTISDTTANRIVVANNNKFVWDSSTIHNAEGAIRLLRDHAKSYHIANNDPRRVIKRS